MDLTEKVLAYQQGSWTWQALWLSISQEVEHYLIRRGLDGEARIDFIDRIHTRVLSMAERFSYFGKTFRALLFTSVRFQLRSYFGERNKRSQKQEVLLEILGKDLYNGETCPEDLTPGIAELHAGIQRIRYDMSTSGPDRRPHLGTQEKKCLIVAFKNCSFIGDDAALTLAAKLSIPPGWLLRSLHELRDLCAHRALAIKEMRRSTNIQQAWSSYASEDCAGIAVSRGRIARIQKRIDKMNPFPRHEDIARLLGIPKGSVDSCLYYARHGRMARLDKKVPPSAESYHENRNCKQ